MRPRAPPLRRRSRATAEPKRKRPGQRAELEARKPPMPAPLAERASRGAAARYRECAEPVRMTRRSPASPLAPDRGRTATAAWRARRAPAQPARPMPRSARVPASPTPREPPHRSLLPCPCSSSPLAASKCACLDYCADDPRDFPMVEMHAPGGYATANKKTGARGRTGFVSKIGSTRRTVLSQVRRVLARKVHFIRCGASRPPPAPSEECGAQCRRVEASPNTDARARNGLSSSRWWHRRWAIASPI